MHERWRRDIDVPPGTAVAVLHDIECDGTIGQLINAQDAASKDFDCPQLEKYLPLQSE